MCCSARHGHTYHADDAETYPADGNRYCKCLGLSNSSGEWLGDAATPVAVHGQCCGAITGEDGYCDRCRETCIPKDAHVQREDLLPGNVIPKGHVAPMSGVPFDEATMAK